jgi:hypothetical protein
MLDAPMKMDKTTLKSLFLCGENIPVQPVLLTIRKNNFSARK